MSDGYFVDAKKFSSGGYYHLFQARFGATAACKERCPNAPFWSGVAAGVAQAPYWLRCLRGSGEGDDENQWDALTTQMSNIILLNNPYANIKRADQLLLMSSAI